MRELLYKIINIRRSFLFIVRGVRHFLHNVVKTGCRKMRGGKFTVTLQFESVAWLALLEKHDTNWTWVDSLDSMGISWYAVIKKFGFICSSIWWSRNLLRASSHIRSYFLLISRINRLPHSDWLPQQQRINGHKIQIHWLWINRKWKILINCHRIKTFKPNLTILVWLISAGYVLSDEVNTAYAIYFAYRYFRDFD